MNIDGVKPQKAVDLYLDDRRYEVSESTLQAHRYRLEHFVRWASMRDDIDDTADLSGRKLHKYKLWRREGGNLNNVSLHTQLSTLRVFIQFLENIEAVPSNLHESIDIPSLNGDDQRSGVLSTERASAIQNYLERYEYASFKHVLFRILWRTGMRIGTARSLDIDDYNSSEMQLRIRHRPDSGTPLKKREDGERIIALNSHSCAIIEDWIENRRPPTEDNGREPLLAKSKSRPSTSTLRRTVYRLTQPCMHSECPHDEDPSECPAEGYCDEPSYCPSIRPPHDIRRGAITNFLSQNNIPMEAVRDRADVSEGVLEDHYDQRSESTKAEKRRDFFSEE